MALQDECREITSASYKKVKKKKFVQLRANKFYDPARIIGCYLNNVFKSTMQTTLFGALLVQKVNVFTIGFDIIE